MYNVHKTSIYANRYDGERTMEAGEQSKKKSAPGITGFLRKDMIIELHPEGQELQTLLLCILSIKISMLG